MPDLTASFTALGNATRFAIVERLLQKGELAAGELRDVEDISPPALSRHFKVLLEAGIISQRIDKQRRLYSVRPEAIKDINEWAMSYRQFWDGSFERLSVALKSEGC